VNLPTGVVDTTNKEVTFRFKDPFRSDTSLRFMRGTNTVRDKSVEEPSESAPKGSNAHEQAAEKAVGEHKKGNKVYKDATKDADPAKQVEGAIADQKKQASQSNNPLKQAANAVADGLKETQQGIADAVQGVPDGLSETKAEEAEDKEVPSVPGCKNSPKGWADAKGNDCEDYAEGHWCTRRGGYGDGWLDEWGNFENVTAKGKTAKQVCCICGGGYREEQEQTVGSAPAAAGITGPILGTKKDRMLQAQGYSGKLVIHEDSKTMTEDWGREFGPRSGHRDIKVICQEHPGNEWCSLHGYYGYGKRSGAPLKSMAATFLALLLACW